jgi:sulfhydrogenase subunit beta (sulfur reductase)
MTVGLLHKQNFNHLLEVLRSEGFQVKGPKIKEGAITLDTIENTTDLPLGHKESQAPGQYQLEKSSDNCFFAFTLGPQSFKKFLEPPRRKLWEVDQKNGEIVLTVPLDEEAPMAFLGVRACELHALKIQDRVFITDDNPNTFYKERRENALIIAVHCQRAAQTCFCPSMETGPEMPEGYDLLLTEQEEYFIIQAKGERGKKIFNLLPLQEAATDWKKTIQLQVENTANSIKRDFPKNKAKIAIKENPNSDFWQDIAQVCTSCANCTLVCPTCFCSSVEDITDLAGEHSERWKKWDSCFNPDFSYIHGGAVRKSVSSRYRQWLSHKFSYWYEQFDSSGCVGCGRCLTWCPVGIDFTESISTLTNKDLL